MKSNIYILNSPKIAESIEVTYTNEILESIVLPAKYPLNVVQFQAFMNHLPMSEELLEFNMGLLKITLSKPTGTYSKIKMFCDKYLEHKKGLKYKVLPKDLGKIKLVPVDEKNLDSYFSSQAFEIAGKDGKGKHSISNYVDNYNLLMQEIASSGKSKHIDYWSEPYENKLKNHQEVSEYWAYLRSLGLEPKKDRLGKTLDWVKSV